LPEGKGKMARKIEIVLDGYVPWQVCPICKGMGKVPDVLAEWGAVNGIYYGEKTCGVCMGAKIIPMCKIGGDESEF
jgi:hypothetical protein